jgi:hypothetical protein
MRRSDSILKTETAEEARISDVNPLECHLSHCYEEFVVGNNFDYQISCMFRVEAGSQEHWTSSLARLREKLWGVTTSSDAIGGILPVCVSPQQILFKGYIFPP